MQMYAVLIKPLSTGFVAEKASFESTKSVFWPPSACSVAKLPKPLLSSRHRDIPITLGQIIYYYFLLFIYTSLIEISPLIFSFLY